LATPCPLRPRASHGSSSLSKGIQRAMIGFLSDRFICTSADRHRPRWRSMTPEAALAAALHRKDHDQGEKPGENSCHVPFLKDCCATRVLGPHAKQPTRRSSSRRCRWRRGQAAPTISPVENFAWFRPPIRFGFAGTVSHTGAPMTGFASGRNAPSPQSPGADLRPLGSPRCAAGAHLRLPASR